MNSAHANSEKEVSREHTLSAGQGVDGGSELASEQGRPAESQLRLKTPVQYLKGVGPERAVLLNRLGIRTVGDLLFHFPRDYQAMNGASQLSDLRAGEPARWIGVIDELDLHNTGPGQSIFGVLVRRDHEFVRAVWFNQPYQRDRLRRGQLVALEGKPHCKGLRWEFIHPRVVDVESAGGTFDLGLMPVYPLTEGVHQGRMREWVQRAVDGCVEEIAEALPESVRLAHDVAPIAVALRKIHKPADDDELARARRRFAFQELLVMQLAVARQRSERLAMPAEPLVADARIDARIRRLFPFPLTADQNRVIEEVARDLGQAVPMNRLLQGDVGTGKTVIAIYAMLVAVAHGHQAALLAPTEVLATQHLGTLRRMLDRARVRLGLLAGQMPSSERDRLIERMGRGEVDIVIGTHALLQDDVRFSSLRLVVIDEQHKFGVKQRAKLRDGEKQPHYLIMTATPIPRSIALSAFGDLESSTLRDPPPGRPEVNTYIAQPEWRSRWWDFVRRKLREGRQAYVVAPVLEGADDTSVTSLQSTFETLANGELEEFRLGLVHGRMSSDEKQEALRAFRDGETQVLVATSVIEVGIDVPNATVLTIESGERFGLAQLHQLRGRVARGAFPGYVCVFAEPKTDEASERLRAFAETRDGFELAERDFRLRGPGEIVGTRQHGSSLLRFADLSRDEPLVELTQQLARELIDQPEYHANAEFARLRQLVQNYYGRSWGFADVG